MRRLLALAQQDSVPTLVRVAAAAGLEPVAADDVGSLLAHLREGPFAATLLSLSIDPMDEAVAKRIGENRHSGSLLLSAPTLTLERALLMERAGAVALLREPLEEDELAQRLAGVVDEGPEVALPQGVRRSEDDDSAPLMIGGDPRMADVFSVIARVAATPSTVLITGESGTGKEVVARALHHASDRRGRPFVAVNCAAIPEHLLESELFGHERGAFTGAVARRVGRFERAQGGTLFLDEIGDMSMVLQAKLLRVLEERTLERVGGEAPVKTDVRIVAATNQALEERILTGRFREDLYYRLAVVELELPPLRHRGDDVRELALHFAAEFAGRYGRPIRAITERALERLLAYSWPGNVRELRNVLDRGVLLSSGDLLKSGELRLGAGSPRTSALAPHAGGRGYPTSLTLAEVEADHIKRVLASVDGHMGRAAGKLGIHRNTLTRKVQEYRLGADAESGEP